MTAQPTAPLSEAPVDAETVAHLMAPAVGVFRRDMSVAETVEELRELTRAALITYCYVTDEAGKLEGVVVMRDMLLAEPEAKLEDLMLRDPYWLPENLSLDEALKAALARHYPVYPVCDEPASGLVRGGLLFADTLQVSQAVRWSASRRRRKATPLMRSLRLTSSAKSHCRRNLAYSRYAGSSSSPLFHGSAGCQKAAGSHTAPAQHAVGEIAAGAERRLVAKEASGLPERLFVGISAGLGMMVYATMQGETHPVLMGLAVTMAMVVSCTVSGLAGALIPLTLKRLGADPATASSIFLTTASDVASMGIFLSLSTLMLL
jgi:magnesium transporter